MNSNFIYIVTHYGCNSSANDMWTPRSTLFENYDEAYNYFLEISPSLDDEQNIAKQYINSFYNHESLYEGYIVIENRVQSYGYLEGDMTCAKRPEGVVLARSGFTISSTILK